MPLPVLGNDGADLLLAGVAPAALDIAEGPAGREIAPARQSPKSPGGAGEGIFLNEIQVQVPGKGGDDGLVMVFPAQVPDNLSRT